MENPANALATLLEDWHIPGNQRPESVRFDGDPDGSAFWAGHRVATRYLLEIEDAIAAMETVGEQVSFYRETLPSWYRAVFAYSTPWQSAQGTTRYVISPADIRLLRALGAHLDAIKWAPPLEIVQIESFVVALQQARALVVDDQTLEPDIKRYILGLIREAEACFEDSSLNGDTVYIRRLSMELGGAMTTVSEMKGEDDPKKQEWADQGKNLLRSIADKVMQKAIESGLDQTVAAVGQTLS